MENMVEVYHHPPKEAKTFAELFSKGDLFGRLRVNYFEFRYQNSPLHNPTGFGLGGSLLARTAELRGFSVGAGLYTSQNLGLLEKDDALFGRSGKDTFSRYDVLAKDRWGMTVLAQAFLQYRHRETYVRIGRQSFESFLTASNDTKMIPNTFEGATLVSRDIPSTALTLAYLTKQKLRDHTRFHDVLTWGDGTGNVPTSQWTQNDDSGVHRGLSHENLEAAGESVEHSLIIAGITNRAVPGLKLDLWYNLVPGSFYSLMLEPNYQFQLGQGWSLSPGLRLMRQFDMGAGAVGGAALLGTLAGERGELRGYRKADSLDAGLLAARLILAKGPGRLLTGYSRVSDDADFVTPWRGFPTAGYTRTMAQVNWLANTRTWSVALFYNFETAGLVRGLRGVVDYVVMDFDDEKEKLGGMLRTDRSVLHADLWYQFQSSTFLVARIRMALVQADHSTLLDVDPSYGELRLELNWLF